MSIYKVKPNSLAMGRDQDQIVALALGSAVAVCLYDETAKVGGITHTLFSCSNRRAMTDEGDLCCTESALDTLLAKLESMGYNRELGWAKIVGGAQIFSFSAANGEDIGKNNVAAARKWLREKSIQIESEDTGDNFGRTVRFFLTDGTVEVETVNQYKYNI